MTSDEHLTPDELAELDEGLLAPDRDPQVRRHLAACTQCQKLADELTTVSGLMRSLGPVSMPPDVVARIDQALAAAGSERAPEAAGGERAPADNGSEPPAAAEGAGSADVVPDLAEVRARRRWISAPTSAAAAVAVLAVVAIVIGVTHHHPKNNTIALNQGITGEVPTSSGARGASGSAVQIQHTGRTYTTANLVSLVPSLVRAGATATSSPAGTSPQVPAATPAPSGAASTLGSGGGTTSGATTHSSGGSDSGQGGRHKGVSHPGKGAAGRPAKLNTVSKPPAAEAAPDDAVPQSLVPFENSLSKVGQCATFNSPGDGAALLAVDLGRWTALNAKSAVPALILVYSDPRDPGMDIVYVVKPSCGGDDVLKFESIPAPS